MLDIIIFVGLCIGVSRQNWHSEPQTSTHPPSQTFLRSPSLLTPQANSNNMQRLLAIAGDLVKSINPSLVSSPPPSTEQTGNDVCYLGPNGDDEEKYLVYCKDLPDGQRAMVGSW
jgi:hypothetical protein